ncbi:hypothetical protein WU86_11770, partial [Corynebacterium xerosis]
MQRVAVDQVWTPVQHTALWLGAWVTGQVSYDHLLDALDAVGGPHTAELIDATVPDVVDLDARSTAAALCAWSAPSTEAA